MLNNNVWEIFSAKLMSNSTLDKGKWLKEYFKSLFIAPGNASSRKTLERTPSNANSKNRCITPTTTTNVTAVTAGHNQLSTIQSVSNTPLQRDQQVFDKIDNNSSPPVVIPPVNIICAPPSLQSQSHPSPYLDNP